MASKRKWATAAGLVVGLLLIAYACRPAGILTPTASAPSVNGGELASHDGEVCPRQLPLGEDPSGYGFGPGTRAGTRPSLLAPESAWVCKFNPVDAGPTDHGGSTVRFERTDAARPVKPVDVPAIAADLDRFTILSRQRACPADLGPRWMLVLEHQGDLTGVVIDDFGCQDARLTDEPFETAPGDPQSNGTVGGVLAPPDGLLDRITAVAGESAGR